MRPRRLVLCVVLLALAACSSGDPLTEALEAHADGNLDEAERRYRSVLVNDPDNVYAHYNLGQIFHSRGNAKEAEGEYRAALVADGDFVPALFNLAVLKTESAPKDAIGLYRKALEVQPDYAAAHLNLGFLLKATGDQEGGQAELDKAVELDPSLESRIDSSPSPAPAGVTTPAP